MIIDMETPFTHGMVIFDKEGVAIKRVQSIDTDNLLCQIKHDDGTEQQETAGGYLIMFLSKETLRKDKLDA